MTTLRAFFSSMTGRIFATLVVGMTLAALAAALVARSISDREFERQVMERTVDRLEGQVLLLDALPANVREQLLSVSTIAGIRAQPADAPAQDPDVAFERALAERGGVLANAKVRRAGIDLCFPELTQVPASELRRVWESEEVRRAIEQTSARMRYPRRQPRMQVIPPVCRLISVPLSDGTELTLSLDTRWIERERIRLLEPAALVLMASALAVLAYLVARIATAPLNRLSNAAEELGQDLDRPPVSVSGPTEVRRAASAFNAMQKQLQQHVAERTRMLAAITHDLQTPLTRLRLRMERVEDEALRERLISDLRAMKSLVDEGLELARSADTAEQRVMLDVDSLLESLVEDASDAGHDARFEGGSHAVLRLRPLAARRMFSNLIDNAIQYGGSVVVAAERANGAVIVRIRDRGPGLPEDMLERVFDPFVRLEHSRSRETGGAGLGLTIARMLAEKNGATVTLRNHPEGGVEATVRWDNAAALENGKVVPGT